MSEVQRSYVTDALIDVKHHKSLLKLLAADLSDEKIVENLKSAVEYLEFVIPVLEAISRIEE